MSPARARQLQGIGRPRRSSNTVTYRKLQATDVKELLRRALGGESAREIGRHQVAERKTVGRYLRAAQQLGLSSPVELTDEVVRAMTKIVQERPCPPRSAIWTQLAERAPQIEEWLVDQLSFVEMHERLTRESVAVSYTMLRRFIYGLRRQMRIRNSAPSANDGLDE
jgi:hypothetical protein